MLRSSLEAASDVAEDSVSEVVGSREIGSDVASNDAASEEVSIGGEVSSGDKIEEGISSVDAESVLRLEVVDCVISIEETSDEVVGED